MTMSCHVCGGKWLLYIGARFIDGHVLTFGCCVVCEALNLDKLPPLGHLVALV